MYTECLGPIDEKKIGDSAHYLETAARKLQQGGLVAFPTETTYGLGATILNESAIKRLYEAKKRKFSRPLPILVAHFDQLKFVVSEIPPEAKTLAKEFLPGPLSIVLKKHSSLPSLITSGKDSVAIRISSNSIAHRLIELTGCPLAATSANSSGKPSPTKASHVLEDFNGIIDGIVDGGEAEYGMESTLVSLEDPSRPTILRFGVISQKEIETVLNRKVAVHPLALVLNGNSSFTKLHIAVRLFSTWEEMKIYVKLSPPSKRLIMGQQKEQIPGTEYFQLSNKNLYDGLRMADRGGCAEVLVHCPPELKMHGLLLYRLKQIART